MAKVSGRKRKKSKYPFRSKEYITYHGRSFRPIVHYSERAKKEYIMVRKKGGGLKRLYVRSWYFVDQEKKVKTRLKIDCTIACKRRKRRL